MKFYPQIDAYSLFNLSQDATEEDIRLAYHKKVQENQELEVFRQAYELIRDKKARKQYFWSSVFSYHDPLKTEECVLLDVEELVAEAAFLSDWELEEIDGDE